MRCNPARVRIPPSPLVFANGSRDFNLSPASALPAGCPKSSDLGHEHQPVDGSVALNATTNTVLGLNLTDGKVGCVIGPYCGVGVVRDSEACDNGNRIGGDGCSPTCRVEVVK